MVASVDNRNWEEIVRRLVAVTRRCTRQLNRPPSPATAFASACPKGSCSAHRTSRFTARSSSPASPVNPIGSALTSISRSAGGLWRSSGQRNRNACIRASSEAPKRIPAAAAWFELHVRSPEADLTIRFLHWRFSDKFDRRGRWAPAFYAWMAPRLKAASGIRPVINCRRIQRRHNAGSSPSC